MIRLPDSDRRILPVFGIFSIYHKLVLKLSL